MKNRAGRGPRLAAAVSALLAVAALAACGTDGAPQPVGTSGASSAPGQSATIGTSAAGGGAPARTRSAAPPSSPAPSGGVPTTAAVGRLVAGFPVDLLPVPKGGTVTASAVVRERSGLVSVSLAGTSPAAAPQVLADFAAALSGKRFVEVPGSLPTGAVGKTFSRAAGREVITVVVVPAGTGGVKATTFTVGGSYQP